MTTPLQSYNSDQAKWEAYQFSDPFATGSFICANKKSKTICRPNCDYLPKVSSKEDVDFIQEADSYALAGYKFCQHCDPSDAKTQLDLPLIKLTIDSINYSIGFTNDSEGKRRALSLPSVAQRKNSEGERQLTRNESEHIKLVELACRHIASAAASSYSTQDADASGKAGKKRRRGGVLGFKELASKSKLSPWHFHRVFKSITGLTPKSYGDQCWKFIKDRERPQLSTRRSHFKSNAEVSSNFHTSRKRNSESSLPSMAAVSTPPSTSPTEEIHEEVSPFSSARDISSFPVTSTNNPPFANQIPIFDSNQNSLDINVNFTPFRHHSLDLGTMLDFSELNSNILNHLSPQYMNNFDNLGQIQSGSSSIASQPFQQQVSPITDANYATYANQQQSLPSQGINNFYTYAPGQVEQTLFQAGDDEFSRSVTLTSTSSHNPIDEAQWPNVQASTPEQTIMSRMLTPPSSVSDSDLKTGLVTDDQMDAHNVSTTEMFYDVLRNSPWNENNEVDIQQNFGLTQEGTDGLLNIDSY